jgi:hypothetical protein
MKRTRRKKTRERSAPRQKKSASTSGRRRAISHRGDTAELDVRQRSRPVDQRTADLKDPVQEKLSRLITLLEEMQPTEFSVGTSRATANTTTVSASGALHKEMLWRIASLEVGMSKLPAAARGTGSNNPLRPGEEEPFTEVDRQAIERAIAVLKKQPPNPTRPPIDALEAAQLLRAIDTRCRNAAPSGASLVKHGEASMPEAAKFAGSEFEKRGMQSPHRLFNRMCALADAAIAWMNSLS